MRLRSSTKSKSVTGYRESCAKCDRVLNLKQSEGGSRAIIGEYVDVYCSWICYQIDRVRIADYRKYVADRKAELPDGARYKSIYHDGQWNFCIEWYHPSNPEKIEVRKWKL